jgi:uncharacterized protein
MTEETVRAVVDFLADVPFACEPLSVVWHAGEPLAAPVTFYEHAFRCFAAGSRGRRFRHCIQTNATLIDDNWCSLISDWSVSVGVSLDGPETIHNAHRVDRSGRGTFARTISGVRQLQKHDIPFHVLTVLTNDSLLAADEMWNCYTDLGVSMVGFNVEEIEGANRTSSVGSPEMPDAFRAFMARIAELEASDWPWIKVREFEDARRLLTAPVGTAPHRSDNTPGAILSVDVNGNVSTFSPELLGVKDSRYGSFCWANVYTGKWSDIIRAPGFHRAWNDIAIGVQHCQDSCAYFELCGGGSPSNKLAENGTFASTETLHCRLHVKAIADVMMDVIERELSSAKAIVADSP